MSIAKAKRHLREAKRLIEKEQSSRQKTREHTLRLGKKFADEFLADIKEHLRNPTYFEFGKIEMEGSRRLRKEEIKEIYPDIDFSFGKTGDPSGFTGRLEFQTENHLIKVDLFFMPKVIVPGNGNSKFKRGRFLETVQIWWS